MHPEIGATKTVLDTLGNMIRDSYADDRTLLEIWGWNCLPLNRHDLHDLVKQAAERLNNVAEADVDSSFIAKLGQIRTKAEQFQTQTLPFLYNGNANAAGPVLISLVEWIDKTLDPYIDISLEWMSLDARNAVPPAMVRRLKSLEGKLQSAERRASNASDKVAGIEAVHAAAQAVKTEIDQAVQLKQSLIADSGTVSAFRSTTEVHANESAELIARLRQADADSKEIIEKFEKAYSAATTVGLGQSFATKAMWSNGALAAWVCGLLIALGMAWHIGSAKVAGLQTLLAAEKINSDNVWIHVFVTAFSVAAPVWFAWLSTKQIGHRFRLAEDYSYKATVAKAYEGYRREAASVDSEFKQTLFEIMLKRIDETPSRFIDSKVDGTPGHEALRNIFGFLKKPKNEAEASAGGG
jgi:hypothetical protein